MTTRQQLDAQLAEIDRLSADAQRRTDEILDRWASEREHAASTQAPFGWRNLWLHRREDDLPLSDVG
ncbi:hypothetical protein ABIB25_003174 [Nakamurella sp. UYEF19]|uniref:hypothetical protein n=1 Tax=Nakamurella sp. UYEF19 TaxID=1756392 RepID=UPI0033973DF3